MIFSQNYLQKQLIRICDRLSQPLFVFSAFRPTDRQTKNLPENLMENQFLSLHIYIYPIYIYNFLYARRMNNIYIYIYIYKIIYILFLCFAKLYKMLDFL